ncbi:MAG: hypothetical protein GKR94_01290 [Gammaproteobacteria bacterium]|nr:hypothetical protein [Gammaproteobacteria bacterium]
MRKRFVTLGVVVMAAGVAWLWSADEGAQTVTDKITDNTPASSNIPVPDPRAIEISRQHAPARRPLQPPVAPIMAAAARAPKALSQPMPTRAAQAEAVPPARSASKPAKASTPLTAPDVAVKEPAVTTPKPARPPHAPAPNPHISSGDGPAIQLAVSTAAAPAPVNGAPKRPQPEPAENKPPNPHISSGDGPATQLAVSAGAGAAPAPVSDAPKRPQPEPAENKPPNPRISSGDSPAIQLAVSAAAAPVNDAPKQLQPELAEDKPPKPTSPVHQSPEPKVAKPSILAPVPPPLPDTQLGSLQPITLPANISAAAIKLPTALTQAPPGSGLTPGLAPKLTKQARAFVDHIAAALIHPIETDKADHFVRPEQRLQLSSTGLSALGPRRSGTAEELLRSPDLDLHTPITVVRVTERLEPLDPTRLLARFDGDLGTPIEVKQGQRITRMTLGKALQHHRLEPSAKLEVLSKLPQYDVTTLEKLRAQTDAAPGTRFEILPHVVEFDETTVEELLGLHNRASGDSVFYIRTVKASDVQGIWGIIHSGLIDNFARGMALQRGTHINTYQVAIPGDADELRADSSSSFLGRLIHRKAAATTIYNFKQGRMSTDADLILPGQQLIIVDFSPSELIAIYQHFVYRANDAADPVPTAQPQRQQ